MQDKIMLPSSVGEIDLISLNTIYVNVESFKRQIPELDDTLRVMRAINSVNSGVIVFPTNKELIVSTLEIKDKTNFRLTGARLKLKGDNVTAFNPVGTISGLEIDHCFITGDGLTSSNHRGISNNSGQNISNFNYHHNVIKDVVVGISLNADLSGTYHNGEVSHNYIKNIVGVLAGQGYGIHNANGTNVNIHHNVLDGVQRHSIYQAKGGAGTRIDYNTIINHRLGVSNLTTRAGLTILRSSEITLTGNTFSNCFDGCINISGENVSSMLGCTDIYISDTTIKNCGNIVPQVTIGEQLIPTYLVDNVHFRNTKFISNSHIGGSFVRYYNGKNITFYDTTFIVKAMPIGFQGFEFNDSHITDITQSDNIKINNTILDLRGYVSGNIRAFFIGNKYATGTMNIELTEVKPNGTTLSNTFYSNTTITNPNITKGIASATNKLTDTTGANLLQLETEVNLLKKALRDLGFMKTV
jgi:hypothetical protein